MAEHKDKPQDISGQASMQTQLTITMQKIGIEFKPANLAWLRPNGIAATEYVHQGGERMRNAVVFQMSRGEFKAVVKTTTKEPAQFEISYGRTKKLVDRINGMTVVELKKELDKLADMAFEMNVARLLR